MCSSVSILKPGNCLVTPDVTDHGAVDWLFCGSWTAPARSLTIKSPLHHPLFGPLPRLPPWGSKLAVLLVGRGPRPVAEPLSSWKICGNYPVQYLGRVAAETAAGGVRWGGGVHREAQALRTVEEEGEANRGPMPRAAVQSSKRGRQLEPDPFSWEGTCCGPPRCPGQSQWGQPGEGDWKGSCAPCGCHGARAMPAHASVSCKTSSDRQWPWAPCGSEISQELSCALSTVSLA